jgi:hypothetical protein
MATPQSRGPGKSTKLSRFFAVTSNPLGVSALLVPDRHRAYKLRRRLPDETESEPPAPGVSPLDAARAPFAPAHVFRLAFVADRQISPEGPRPV